MILTLGLSGLLETEGIDTDSLLVDPSRTTIVKERLMGYVQSDIFLQALKNDGAYEVRIASKQIDRRLTADSKNVTVLQPSSAGEVTDLLAWGPLIGLPSTSLIVAGVRLVYDRATRVFRYRRHPVCYADLNRELLEQARSFAPDLLLVPMGFQIAPSTLAAIKRETNAVLVNYATDDPFKSRVGTPELMKSIPVYDIYPCTKKAIMDDVAAAGCRNVRYVRFAFKPRVHFCELPRTADEQKRFAADVAFVGEGDADRPPYFLTLSKAVPRVNLALYGGLWNRHPATRRYSRGSVRERELRLAFGGAKIAVNLIRRENRDDHVMRTFEGPARGAFMLNERTNEHLELFEEGSEAAYFVLPRSWWTRLATTSRMMRNANAFEPQVMRR